MMYVPGYVHRMGKFLVPLQGMLTNSKHRRTHQNYRSQKSRPQHSFLLGDKLKLQLFFEQVHCRKRKAAYTIGFVTAITKRTVFQVYSRPELIQSKQLIFFLSLSLSLSLSFFIFL